jgi:F-type H+-transporting ATPase subunit epsilon
MGIGVLRVETPQAEHKLFVDGGFAQMVDNRLTLLTEQAKPAADIDRAAAEKALAEARSLPMITDAEFAARQKAVQRAEVQIHLTEG